MKKDYPKWLYHAEQEAVCVASEDEHKAKCPAPDWHEFPVEQSASEESDDAEGEAEAAAPKKRGRRKSAA